MKNHSLKGIHGQFYLHIFFTSTHTGINCGVYCCHNCPKTHYASFHRKLLSSLSQYVHTTIFVQDKVIVHSILCKRSSQN